MDWVRVVVCNYSCKLYFGSVFNKGISVVFRNTHVRVGEVYDVTLRENGAPSSAKAKFDVVECRHVPTHEFTNIRVTDDQQVLITCIADFVSRDHKDRSVKIFQNEVFGIILDLKGLVPNGFKKAEVEFRYTSSPRNKFSTICVVNKFIRGHIISDSSNKHGDQKTSSETLEYIKDESRENRIDKQEACDEINKKPSRLVRQNTKDKSDSMFASRIRRPKYNRDEYMLDDDDEEIRVGSVQDISSTTNFQTMADKICHLDNSVSSDNLDSYDTAVEDSCDDDTAVISTDYERQHKGFVNHFYLTGEAVVWCVDLYRDIVLDLSESKTVMLGKWYEFNITNDANPTIIHDSLRRIKNYTPTCMVNGHPELKCELVFDEILSKQYDSSIKCILYSDLVGTVVCDIPSVCESIGPGCRLFAWIVRFKCGDRVCWVVSSKSPISSIKFNQATRYDDDSYSHNAPSPYITKEIPEYAKVHTGFVNHLHSSGKAAVWCIERNQDIELDVTDSKGIKLGDWIEFNICNSTLPTIVSDSISVIKDPVSTRIANGLAELECDLVFKDNLPDHSSGFNFYSDIVGDVLCDIPSVCDLSGPGCRFTCWIVRFKCRDGRVRWLVSSKYSVSLNDVEQVAKCNADSFVAYTPSESADSESLPDSYCSSPTDSAKTPFTEICQFPPEVTFGYVFNKHPSLLNLLASLDEEAHERVTQLM